MRRGLLALMLLALALFASSAYSASKTVVVLGDSLSAEYGLARGSGWVSLLQNRLHAEKRNATVVNASISGDTTSGGASRLPALLKKHRPDILIIELGGNDGLRGLSLAATESNLRTMIKAGQDAGAKVLLLGMRLPPNYGATYTENFYALYGKLARESRTALVPFLLAGVADRAELFQPDRIHPAAAAHPVMLDNVWPVLKPLL
ncbi:arylesterase [Janthinobacterium sp. 17J80-10]|uniref:arylesterase n=1 Tax=Janthinobacterium sp. 17J80-10 TaxID=2497863 RepID=UPI001F5150F2|nr:arylesterase [Janthinobacterium sp. 17J80-10]